MPYTQEQLKNLYLNMGEETPELGVYPSIGTSHVDNVVLQGIARKSPDGEEQLELAIGVELYGHTAVAFPLINVLKFAMQEHPELLERAQAELNAVQNPVRLGGAAAIYDALTGSPFGSAAE